jgi:hypothetical protein
MKIYISTRTLGFKYLIVRIVIHHVLIEIPFWQSIAPAITFFWRGALAPGARVNSLSARSQKWKPVTFLFWPSPLQFPFSNYFEIVSAPSSFFVFLLWFLEKSPP